MLVPGSHEVYIHARLGITVARGVTGGAREGINIAAALQVGVARTGNITRAAGKRILVAAGRLIYHNGLTSLGVFHNKVGHLIEVGLREFVAMDKGLGRLPGILAPVVGQLNRWSRIGDVNVEHKVVLLALVQLLAGAGLGAAGGASHIADQIPVPHVPAVALDGAVRMSHHLRLPLAGSVREQGLRTWKAAEGRTTLGDSS